MFCFMQFKLIMLIRKKNHAKKMCKIMTIWKREAANRIIDFYISRCLPKNVVNQKFLMEFHEDPMKEEIGLSFSLPYTCVYGEIRLKRSTCCRLRSFLFKHTWWILGPRTGTRNPWYIYCNRWWPIVGWAI
jgi:hypothetical protein